MRTVLVLHPAKQACAYWHSQVYPQSFRSPDASGPDRVLGRSSRTIDGRLRPCRIQVHRTRVATLGERNRWPCERKPDTKGIGTLQSNELLRRFDVRRIDRLTVGVFVEIGNGHGADLRRAQTSLSIERVLEVIFLKDREARCLAATLFFDRHEEKGDTDRVEFLSNRIC